MKKLWSKISRGFRSDVGNCYQLPKAELTYAEDLLYTYHNADFMLEPRFAEAYRLSKQVDADHLLKNYDIRWRIHVLCFAASHAAQLPGDFVDCGAGSGIFARAITHYVDFRRLRKTYFLLDTFRGLDPRYSSSEEMRRNDQFGYAAREDSYERVREMFKLYNVEIIRGAIPETLPRVKTGQVGFLSIDMNAVVPEVAALEFFWDRMVPGGIIILDDYGYPGFGAQKVAHDQFARSKNVMILSLPTCQGMIIKP